ncbi:MAG TPA: hypothetical protein VJR29_11640 [bacterium]|nr:hypothetical protein [bacterium]
MFFHHPKFAAIRPIFNVLALGLGISLFSAPALAGPIEVQCAPKTGLNSCIAQVCANPDGGRVLLKNGVYDANTAAAINGLFGAPTCSGGISIVGKGPQKTQLVSNGPNLFTGSDGITRSLNWALALGSPLGGMGPVGLRDLAITCGTPGSCPVFGASAHNAESAEVSNVKIEGFVRGFHGGSSNLVIQQSAFVGVGADNFNGRGIFVSHPFGERVENISVSNNLIRHYWRGLVAAAAKDVVVTQNAVSDAAQGVFAQDVENNLEVSQNLVQASDLGLILNVGVFEIDPETEEFIDVGNSIAQVTQNLLVESAIGIGLSFAKTFEAEVTVTHNLILETDSALVFDPDVNPPNLPPVPPDVTYDPCLHEVLWEHNLVLPLSSLPEFGSCDP